MRRTVKCSFSLIEVLFAVAFLVMVGAGLSALTGATLRLITSTELDAVVYPLSEEALAVIAYQRRVLGEEFGPTVTGLGCVNGCYLECPVAPLNAPCKLANQPTTVQLGRARLQFTRKVEICILEPGEEGEDACSAPENGDYNQAIYLATVTTSWGSGIQRQVKVTHRFE